MLFRSSVMQFEEAGGFESFSDNVVYIEDEGEESVSTEAETDDDLVIL